MVGSCGVGKGQDTSISLLYGLWERKDPRIAHKRLVWKCLSSIAKQVFQTEIAKTKSSPFPNMKVSRQNSKHSSSRHTYVRSVNCGRVGSTNSYTLHCEPIMTWAPKNRRQHLNTVNTVKSTIQHPALYSYVTAIGHHAQYGTDASGWWNWELCGEKKR